MLSSRLKHQIVSQSLISDIITMKKRRRITGNIKIIEKTLQPNNLSSDRCHGMIFSLCRGSCNCCLLLRILGDKIRAKKSAIAGYRLAVTRIRGTIYIRESRKNWKTSNIYSIGRGAFNIGKNPFEMLKMFICRIVHKLWELINCIC